jgi:hypothetical protein
MLKKEKVFRDPIHRYITVDDEFIWQLINTKAFQRLNNLHQLGGAYQIFHGATHTRFAHSLGVYAIARELYERTPVRAHMTDNERKLLFTAALLHDIGHGPYSHAAEKYLLLTHEAMSARIILEDGQIRKILDGVGAAFAQQVVAVLEGTYDNPLLHHIISNQVDVDRMDYLLRDGYYAGVSYGDYDKDRIIRVVRVCEQQLTFAESGLHALENFMVSRYHMRRQVYYNSKGRAFEALLKASVQRFKELWRAHLLADETLYRSFFAFLSTDANSNIMDFLAFDDHMFMAVQHLLMREKDTVITTIAHAIVERSLPQVFEIDSAMYDVFAAKIARHRSEGNPLGFYVDVERVGNPLIEANEQKQIRLLCKDGTIKFAGEISPILQALAREAAAQRYYVFLHKTLLAVGGNDPVEILRLNQF